MARTRKTWAEKLADARAKADAPRRFQCEKSGQWLVIPSVDEVEQMVCAVPKGEVTTVATMTATLRERHAVDQACPITTGIFLWMLAHASDEQEQQGGEPSLPWWRVVRKDGELNPKYPGAGAMQRARLEAEGHTVVQKGARLVVAGGAGVKADASLRSA